MASLLDRAKSLSKLWSSKKKGKRVPMAPMKASSTSPLLDLTGDTFTMRLMRPEMRRFHRERVRRESMGSTTDTASITSTLSEPCPRARAPSARRHSAIESTRFYRAEVTRSACDDRVSVSSEDQDDLLAKVDEMEAELRARKRSTSATPLGPDSSRLSVSDADSGLDSASVVTASSQTKSESKKGVRFLFPDARVPILYPGKGDLDLIRDDEDLDTDEEYLGTI